jgi:hypothetical protein
MGYLSQALQWLWFVQIGAGLAVYVLLPGTLVVTVIQPEADGAHRAALSCSLGYVLFVSIALIALPFNATFELLNLLFSVIAAVAAMALFINRSLKTNFRISGTTLLVAIAAACGFGLSLLSGWFPRGDASVHLQSINNLVQEGRVAGARYSLVGQPEIPDQVFNAHHVLLALISRSFGLSPDIAWHYFSPVLAVFVPSTVLLMISAVTEDHRLQIFTLTSFMVLALLFPLLMQGAVFDALVYPNRIYLWVVIPSAVYFLFKYYESGSRGALMLIAAHVVTIFAVHVEGFLWLVVVTCGIAALAIPLRQTRIHVPVSRSVPALLTVLLSGAPFLIWRAESNAAFIDKVADPVWLVHYSAWRVTDHFYALNPARLGWYSVVAGVLAAGSLAAYTAVNFFGRTLLAGERKFILLLAVSFLPFLLIFNPILFPVAMDVVGSVPLNRMQRIPLYYFAIGAVFFVLCSIGRRFFDLRVNYIATCSLMVVGAFFISVAKLPEPSADHITPWPKAFLPLLGRDSLVLADPVTSSDVASMTPAAVLSIRFNGAVELIDLSEEKEAISSFFAGDELNARQVIERFEPTHVVAQAGDQKLLAMTFPFLSIVMDTPEGALFEVDLR